MNKDEIVLFETKDKRISLPVKIENDMVWLSRKAMAELFGRDIKTIGKHIANARKEELAEDISVIAHFATTAADGKTYQVEHYNLDIIISVGYRVKSQRGVEFRKWANTVLKRYIVQGYAANAERLKQLGKTVELIKRAESSLDGKQIVSVIERYARALELLDDYDRRTVRRPKGTKTLYVLNYGECMELIENMRFSAESELFGREKDDSFKGSIGNIYQSAGGVELYPSGEEKAANLLYFVTKNHSFLDGNKRIAAALFVYFLDKNGLLFADGKKRIDDYTLAALTIMIAESKPEEKEIMISIIMNCIA